MATESTTHSGPKPQLKGPIVAPKPCCSDQAPSSSFASNPLEQTTHPHGSSFSRYAGRRSRDGFKASLGKTIDVQIISEEFPAACKKSQHVGADSKSHAVLPSRPAAAIVAAKVAAKEAARSKSQPLLHRPARSSLHGAKGSTQPARRGVPARPQSASATCRQRRDIRSIAVRRRSLALSSLRAGSEALSKMCMPS
eukprot:TRINITY_DN30871_c0_g2_i3.p2 TRINITY_DN30871_c0_g2~~TRINITY_DN30871_c0_g2_i3.p2  ORF type:complete len:196 (+),score=31.95 TRINITY_DN30871_c0_g2_i3:60-647(+)